MKNKLYKIKRLHAVIDRSLFYLDGTLDYDRITDALITLSNAIMDYDGDDETMWNTVGEFSPSNLPDMIVGAYWHYTEWHGGQCSKGYAALSALGDVFNPGMTMPDRDNETYLALESIAH